MSEKNREAVADLLGNAKQELRENMKQRGIGAILWDNATAGFPYLPEIALPSDDGEPRTSRVMGIYSCNDELYLIEEDVAPVKFDDFWNPDTESKPEVVTLSEDIARKDLGDPASQPGYTEDADLEEWLAISDCYFQALAEKFED